MSLSDLVPKRLIDYLGMKKCCVRHIKTHSSLPTKEGSIIWCPTCEDGEMILINNTWHAHFS